MQFRVCANNLNVFYRFFGGFIIHAKRRITCVVRENHCCGSTMLSWRLLSLREMNSRKLGIAVEDENLD